MLLAGIHLLLCGMLWLIATVALVAAPEPVHSIAIPGLACANIDAKLSGILVTHFAQQLSIHGGFTVTTAEEVAAMLGMERQRQLLACGENSDSCNAEIAAALGSDVIVTGTVSKVGTAFLVNLKMISAHSLKPLAVYSGRPKTEDALLDLFEAWATDFGSRFAEKGAPGASATVAPVAAVSDSGGTNTRPLAIAGLAGGGALAIGGVIALVLAQGTAANVRKGNFTTPDAFNRAISEGRTEETVGYVLVGVGAAAAVAGVVLLVTGSSTHVAMAPTPGGAVAVFSGEFP